MSSVTDLDFESIFAVTPPPVPQPYIISGTITPTTAGAPVQGGPYTPDVSGVYVTLTWTRHQLVALTDSNGNYQFSGLPNGTYNIIPAKYAHTATPATQVIVIADGNATAANTALGAGYLISGTIRYENSNVVGVGWVVNFVGPRTSGTEIGTATTAASGLFTITPCPPGIYVVTPDRAGYRFDPPSRTMTIGTAHSTLNDFVAIPL